MDSGVLHLQNVSSEDSGYYWCSATNHITSETYTANSGTRLLVQLSSSVPRKSPEFLIKPKPYFVVPQGIFLSTFCFAMHYWSCVMCSLHIAQRQESLTCSLITPEPETSIWQTTNY